MGWSSFATLHGLSRTLHYISMVFWTHISFVNVPAKTHSQPIHYAWDRAEMGLQGHCFNVDAFFIGSGSANVALNFVIFVLVCPPTVSS